MDDAIGSVGTSVDMDDERAAREEALRRCVKPGSQNCSVRFTYENQCVALAWPGVLGKPVGLVSGASTRVAEALALQDCAKTGGGECRVVYSECTDPKFIRY